MAHIHGHGLQPCPPGGMQCRRGQPAGGNGGLGRLAVAGREDIAAASSAFSVRLNFCLNHVFTRWTNCRHAGNERK
jgi:hypothetical protein